MFGLSVGKHKRKLEYALADCLLPLKDELGNVPIPMQTDPAINGAVLGICDSYAALQGVNKPSELAKIADGVFEELYRSESINVQNRVDTWRDDKNSAFVDTYQQAINQTTADLDLTWLAEYAKAHFEPATGKML